MSERILIVGESNPYGADQYFALYPSPVGCAGWRLCEVVLRLPRAEYLRRYDRANLCAGAFSVFYARRAAHGMVSTRRKIIALGRKVAAAFDLDDVAPFGLARRGDTTFAVLPHPSGRCRLWNAPGAYERGRSIVRTLEESV